MNSIVDQNMKTTRYTAKCRNLGVYADGGSFSRNGKECEDSRLLLRTDPVINSKRGYDAALFKLKNSARKMAKFHSLYRRNNAAECNLTMGTCSRNLAGPKSKSQTSRQD